MKRSSSLWLVLRIFVVFQLLLTQTGAVLATALAEPATQPLSGKAQPTPTPTATATATPADTPTPTPTTFLSPLPTPTATSTVTPTGGGLSPLTDIGTLPQLNLPSIRGFNVSEQTGAATINYPLILPPGPGGFAPHLSFNYSSSSADDIQGKMRVRITKTSPACWD